MISFNRRTRIFVYKNAIDMRASYDRLFFLVKEEIKGDPFSGHLYLFVNNKRTSCKSLFFDGTGFVLLSKRLEEGRFTKFNDFLQREIELTPAEFGLFFEGSDLTKRFIESPRLIKKSICK